MPPGTVEQVASKVVPSVVMLETDIGRASEEGSGVILSSDGLILTNNHVIAAAAAPPKGPGGPSGPSGPTPGAPTPGGRRRRPGFSDTENDRDLLRRPHRTIHGGGCRSHE